MLIGEIQVPNKVLTVPREVKLRNDEAILIWLEGQLSRGYISVLNTHEGPLVKRIYWFQSICVFNNRVLKKNAPGKTPAENKEIYNYTLTCKTPLLINDRTSIQKKPVKIQKTWALSVIVICETNSENIYKHSPSSGHWDKPQKRLGIIRCMFPDTLELKTQSREIFGKVPNS